MRSKEVEEAIQEIQKAIEYDKEHRIVTVFDKTPLFRDVLQTALDYISELEEENKGYKNYIEKLDKLNERDFIFKDVIRDKIEEKQKRIDKMHPASDCVLIDDLENQIQVLKEILGEDTEESTHLVSKNGNNFEFGRI